MKFTQILDQNMVPEWRDQYLDYKLLDDALHKAISDKTMKCGRKGLNNYFELIKFNQKFANYFSLECQAQLDKINAFHREKLEEMKGKYGNLQEQLDLVLSSAIYQQVQPVDNALLASSVEDNKAHSAAALTLINSISDGVINTRSRVGTTRSNSHTITLTTTTNHLDSKYLEDTPRLNEISNSSLSLASRNSMEKVSNLVRKLSESFSESAHRLGNMIENCHHHNSNSPVKLSAGSQESILTPTCENQLLAGAVPQSKEKIIASLKRKLSHLKFAFRELYFSLVVFEQYTQLNYTGFEQILRKHDRMFASTWGRKFYQEYVQTADFYSHLHIIDHLIEGVEHIYTIHFENGDRQKAIEKLQVPSDVYKQTSPMLDFRVGCEFGMFAIMFLAVLTVGLVVDTKFDWRTVFRLYRTPLIIIIFLLQAAISIVIWKHYKINHVLIFEMEPRSNLSFHHFLEFGSLSGVIWSISVLLFLFSPHLGIMPSVCPLVVIVIIGAYLFNPTATCHYQSRFWLLKKLGRVVSAPFHPVKFADFWIADQMVSIVPLFLDLEYLSCFYTTGSVWSESHLNSDYASRCVTRNPQDLVIRTIVAALPAWFRCAQCLRRWHDENWLPLHIANAGKYWCMVSVIFLSSIAQYNNTSFTMRIVWLSAAIFTSSLTAYWDIIYDFGLFSKYDKDTGDDGISKKNSINSNSSRNDEFYIQEATKRKKKKTYPFLRKELVYPVWVYYFAIVEDVILRFSWIFSVSLTEFSNIEAELVVSLLAPIEMFRRFVWNCIRLENEQLNNCGLFRAVRDIPIEVFAPIDESHLDKVIMMMDSKDGPAMRNRIMKRRALRPDKVSFLVLQQPNSATPDSDVTKRCDIRESL